MIVMIPDIFQPTRLIETSLKVEIMSRNYSKSRLNVSVHDAASPKPSVTDRLCLSVIIAAVLTWLWLGTLGELMH